MPDADLLRRAAALMRERAEAATWTAAPWGVDEIGAVWAQEADGQPIPISSRSTDADAEHIASWHPAVALAVADWLDAEAESHRADLVGPFPSACCRMSQALAVARAYLGSDDE